MDLALHTALVTHVLTVSGGTLDDAFTIVDDLVAEHGAPSDVVSLLEFMQAVEARAVLPVG